jgi:phosphate acetyltransferase
MTTGNQSLFDAFSLPSVLSPPGNFSSSDHTCSTDQTCSSGKLSSPNSGLRRIVFPDGDDPRVVAAACRASQMSMAAPILLGARADIEQIALEAGGCLDLVEIVDPEESVQFDEYALEFAERRDIPLHTARCMTTVPFYFAAMMLSSGDADAMIAGARCSSQEVLMATDMIVGTAENTPTPSSFLVLEVPGYAGPEGELLVLSDSVVNPEPTPDQLADIVLATADNAEAVLGWDAHVALLSHSTHGHPLEPRAEHVCKAVDIVRRRAPGLKVDGELQLDAALNLAVARKKLPLQSSVAGRANVLIFPDMNAASIAVKLAHELADATICGPILHGFNHPLGIISRGATIRDVLGTIALTSAYTINQMRPLPRAINSINIDARAAGESMWSPRVVRA